MTLLITATEVEGKPLRESLEEVGKLDFPLGQLYSGKLRGREVYLAHLGVAKVNTAAGLALAIHTLQPERVIQFGVGGAYVGSFLSIGMVAVAEKEVHIDTGVLTAEGWLGMNEVGFPLLEDLYNVFPTDEALTLALERTTGAVRGVFGTSETVTGSFGDAETLQQRFDLSIESMEGAAAAQVCAALGVPFAEIRSVSNIVGERNKRAWNVPLAVRSVNQALLDFLKR